MKVIKTSTGDYWVADEDGYDVTRNEYGDQHTFATPEKAREAALEAMNNGPFAKKYRGLNSQSFKNPHFEEPNVLAHVRHDDRIDTDGKKNLFLEEIQSDWHQAGKQEGYRVPVDTKELARQLDNANDAYQTVSKRLAANPEDAQAKADAHAAFQETQRLERAYNAATAQRGVPDAPFKNDWHELVMKRMLREAAEKGYDRLSWTTGDQQAERYDLSKHIGRVEYDPKRESYLLGTRMASKFSMANPLSRTIWKSISARTPQKGCGTRFPIILRHNRNLTTTTFTITTAVSTKSVRLNLKRKVERRCTACLRSTTVSH